MAVKWAVIYEWCWYCYSITHGIQSLFQISRMQKIHPYSKKVYFYTGNVAIEVRNVYPRGKILLTRIASERSPAAFTLPVVKACIAFSLPSAIASQSLSVMESVRSGFSTPPVITSHV